MPRFDWRLSLHDMLSQGIELVYPRIQSCGLCGGFTQGIRTNHGLCPICYDRWARMLSSAKPCPHCGFFAGGVECRGPCKATIGTLAFIAAAAPYEGMYRQMLHSLKYNRDRALAEPMGYMMAKTLAPRISSGIRRRYVLVPVPLYRDKEAERGFNQSLLLAENLGRCLSLPVRQTLVRLHSGKTQARLNKRQRLREIGQIFAGTPDIITLKSRSVLLVDDVVTTGATLMACAEIFKNIGIEDLSALAFAAGFNHEREVTMAKSK